MANCEWIERVDGDVVDCPNEFTTTVLDADEIPLHANDGTTRFKVCEAHAIELTQEAGFIRYHDAD